jgi:hypothetical protein
MMIKIEIKKIRWQKKKRKITLTKGQKNQENEDQIRKKIIYHKFRLKNKIEN